MDHSLLELGRLPKVVVSSACKSHSDHSTFGFIYSFIESDLALNFIRFNIKTE